MATDIELRDVQRGFRGMTRRAESQRRSFFEAAKKPAKADLRERQAQRRGPHGESWPGRAASSMQRARRGGKRRAKSRSRSLLGVLPRSWKSQVSNEELRMVNHAPFAEAQHKGATVGNNARLPARPFIGFSRGFIGDMHDGWEEYVLEGWERG